MTTEDLAKLTPEEKRIRIAELHGWKRGSDLTHEERTHFNHPTYDTAYFQKTPSGWEIKPAPDYLNDLNTIAGARSGMTPEQRADYVAHLWDALGLPREPHSVNFWTAQNTDGFFACIDAPADKHCDAFLLTLG